MWSISQLKNQKHSVTQAKFCETKNSSIRNTVFSGYDMYDFSEVTSDLAILRSQLFTLNVGEKPKPNNHVTATWDPQWDIFYTFKKIHVKLVI